MANELIINANQNAEAYARLGHRVVPDELKGFAGPLAGLHAGLKAASGEYITILGSDDMYLPQNLEIKTKFLDSHPDVGLVCSDAYVFDNKTGSRLPENGLKTNYRDLAGFHEIAEHIARTH